MLIVYECFIAPGFDPEKLLSEDAVRETQAQVMTLEEAVAVGFSGLESDAKGREVRLIAVAKRDAQFIQRRLEANEACSSFKVHEVDM